MKKRNRVISLALVVALSLSLVAGQIANAGTAIRCGSACQTASFVATPPPPSQ